MGIQIIEEKKVEFDFDYKKTIKKVIDEALLYFKLPYPVEVTITLTGNDEIEEINNEFRDVDSPTDVLSFPMIDFNRAGNFDFIEENSPLYFNMETKRLLLGDIVLSLDKVFEQADLYGHSYERELAFLILHSMLHLFGFDHMTSDEAKYMEEIQEEILRKVNINR